MKPPSDVVLVIAADVLEPLPAHAARALRQAGLDVQIATRADAVTTLAELLANDAPPPAVLFGADLVNPLGIARQVRQLAPLVQIVLLADVERAEQLRQEMVRAPIGGSNWTTADPDAATFPRLLTTAVRATRQRSNLRTTLDRMNLKIQAPRPDPDGEVFRKLVVSDRYLASILEHAGDAILAVDASHRITIWNRSASLLFGRSEADVLDRSVELLVGEDRAAALLGMIREARSGGMVARQEIACVRADGTNFDAEVTVAPVRGDVEYIDSVAVIARDMTRRKRDEARLRQVNGSLQEALDQLESKKRALQDANALLSVQATTDALTGLKNRNVFHNGLNEMIAIASRTGVPLSLLLVDIDHFKRINDARGHVEGDRVLREVATCLMRHTRQRDIVARYGGEEFAIVLPDATSSDALNVGEKLRSGCLEVLDSEQPLSVSVGAAMYRTGDTDLSLIKRADEALYASKRAGRNRVTLVEA